MTELAPQQPGIPVPVPSRVSEPYWAATCRQQLLFQKCGTCGRIPARPARKCWVCGGGELEWVESSGIGTLYSWTVVWRPQHPSFTTPYAPAVMAVEEGWWLMTAIIGCEVEDLREGLPLEVQFHEAAVDIWLPYARPRA